MIGFAAMSRTRLTTLAVLLAVPGAAPTRFDLAGLRRIWRFSAGLAVTAILGAIDVVFGECDR